jgi:hypothetical protein
MLFFQTKKTVQADLVFCSREIRLEGAGVTDARWIEPVGSKTFGWDELQLDVKFNYNLIIKKMIAKIA